LSTGAVVLGPPLENVGHDLLMIPWTFCGDGTKLYMKTAVGSSIWAVQGDMRLTRLNAPNAMRGGAVFDREGKRVLTTGGSTDNRVQVWDLSQNRILKLLDQAPDHGGLAATPGAVHSDFSTHSVRLGHNVQIGPSGFTATLSPDGRWLAAVNDAKDAPVVVWDLDVPDTADPAHSLDAVCNLDQGDCIRRLCQKISAAIDGRQLRGLVGDEAFDQLNSTIRTASPDFSYRLRFANRSGDTENGAAARVAVVS